MGDKYENVIKPENGGLDYAGDNDIDRSTAKQRANVQWDSEREGIKAGWNKKSVGKKKPKGKRISLKKSGTKKAARKR